MFGLSKYLIIVRVYMYSIAFNLHVIFTPLFMVIAHNHENPHLATKNN